MKKTVIIASLIVLAFSCKKDECKQCHYDKGSAEVELGEKCGDDIATLEANGYSEGGVRYTVHCGEDH